MDELIMEAKEVLDKKNLNNWGEAYTLIHKLLKGVEALDAQVWHLYEWLDIVNGLLEEKEKNDQDSRD